MILAIVDDLMFTSKIRQAARASSTPVAFARSVDAALAEMRAQAPALVVLDLNSPRLDALGVVAAMKADPALAGIPTLGFAQHTDAATIQMARAAGVSDVMARSAFFNQLPALISR